MGSCIQAIKKVKGPCDFKFDENSCTGVATVVCQYCKRAACAECQKQKQHFKSNDLAICYICNQVCQKCHRNHRGRTSCDPKLVSQGINIPVDQKQEVDQFQQSQQYPVDPQNIKFEQSYNSQSQQPYYKQNNYENQAQSSILTRNRPQPKQNY